MNLRTIMLMAFILGLLFGMLRKNRPESTVRGNGNIVLQICAEQISLPITNNE